MNFRRAIWPASASIGGVLVGVLSFSQVPDAEPSHEDAEAAAPEPSATTIRLTELTPSSVEGPYSELAPASSLADVGDARARVVFEQDLGSLDTAALGWSFASGDGIVDRGGRRALVLRSRGALPGYGWLVPAEPGRFYRLLEEAEAQSAPSLSTFVLELTEATEAVTPRSVPSEELRATFRDSVRAHRASSAGTVELRASASTRSLLVMVARLRHTDEAGEAERHRAFFDLRLEELELTEQAQIALFAGTHGDGREQAMSAGATVSGLLTPLGVVRAGAADSGDEAGFSYRRALYAPAPTELSYELDVSRDSVLRFATTLGTGSAPGAAVRFEVISGDSVLFRHTHIAERSSWGWDEHEVPLEAIAGEGRSITLRTIELAPGSHALFGHPVVEPAHSPRHVIVVAVDTLRADRLGLYGYERPTSPNLQRLADDGVRFEHTIAQANWTCPSFASIFTGLSPSRHGVYGHGIESPLADAHETLAERFAEAGYATEAIAYKPALYDGGYEQGFDVATIVPRRWVRADENLARAIEWLDSNRERSAFLFLHFNDPHQPFTQPPPFSERFGRGPVDVALPWSVPNRLEDAVQRTLASDLYDQEVAYVDDRIGAFFDELRVEGLYDDATIVFVSDHGEALWEHGRFGHGGRHLYDELLRVPLVIKPPAGWGHDTGAVVRSQVRAFDIMPTLLELAELPAVGDIDAQTLVPLLRGEPEDDRDAFAESSRGTVALRTAAAKYVLTQDGDAPREELYLLGDDPGETNDRAADRPELLAQLRHRAVDYLMSSRPGRYVVVVGREAQLDGAHRPIAVGQTLRLVTRVTGELTVDGAPLDEPQRYEAGVLSTLLETPGVHVFEGPPRRAQTGPATQIDAQQLEALRALGYIE